MTSNFQSLSRCVNVCYVAGHEGAKGLLFQCIVSVLRVMIILWCIDPFLGNDLDSNNKKTAVDRQQRRSKQQLKHNCRETVFSVRSMKTKLTVELESVGSSGCEEKCRRLV
jgi:hypothetical protein